MQSLADIDRRDRFGGRHAIVAGGSIAGLVAARVLADHFERVTLVERDHLPEGPEARKGVPQGRHGHFLVKRGEEILEALFPGLVSSLLSQGATSFDLGRDARWFHFGAWKHHFDDGPRLLSLSRLLLEAEVRRRVRSIANLTVLDGTEVVGLLAPASGAVVSGVRTRRRDVDARESIEGELVVDASGRGSPFLRWLGRLGYEPPPVTEVRIRLGYGSRLYRVPPAAPPWHLIYAVAKPPGGRRFGFIHRIEGDRWLCTLGGYLDDHPPEAAKGFVEFARGLPIPDLHDAIRDAEPLSDIAIHKVPVSRRQHFERVSHLPEGMVFVGDALCALNPLYGQGMTVGAMTALALGTALSAQREQHGRGRIEGLARAYHRRAAQVVNPVWALSASEDLRYPEVEGRRQVGFQLLQWYAARVHEAAALDAGVASAFYRVLNLLDSPATLMHPRLLAGVARAHAVSEIEGWLTGQ